MATTRGHAYRWRWSSSSDTTALVPWQCLGCCGRQAKASHPVREWRVFGNDRAQPNQQLCMYKLRLHLMTDDWSQVQYARTLLNDGNHVVARVQLLAMKSCTKYCVPTETMVALPRDRLSYEYVQLTSTHHALASPPWPPWALRLSFAAQAPPGALWLLRISALPPLPLSSLLAGLTLSMQK
jgi:hypothetical protein